MTQGVPCKYADSQQLNYWNEDHIFPLLICAAEMYLRCRKLYTFLAKPALNIFVFEQAKQFISKQMKKIYTQITKFC